ncbi:hypothetical protein YC2023_016077 [Brassica napus]
MAVKHDATEVHWLQVQMILWCIVFSRHIVDSSEHLHVKPKLAHPTLKLKDITNLYSRNLVNTLPFKFTQLMRAFVSTLLLHFSWHNRLLATSNLIKPKSGMRQLKEDMFFVGIITVGRGDTIKGSYKSNIEEHICGIDAKQHEQIHTVYFNKSIVDDDECIYDYTTHLKQTQKKSKHTIPDANSRHVRLIPIQSSNLDWKIHQSGLELSCCGKLERRILLPDHHLQL